MKDMPRMICISINMEETGDNIKRLACARGISINDLMEATGVSSKQAIYKWFSGKSLPEIETQLALCKLFDLKLEELLVTEGG